MSNENLRIVDVHWPQGGRLPSTVDLSSYLDVIPYSGFPNLGPGGPAPTLIKHNLSKLIKVLRISRNSQVSLI